MLYMHTPSANLGWSPLHLLISFLKRTRAALFPWPQKGGSQERFHRSGAMNKMTMEVESFIKKNQQHSVHQQSWTHCIQVWSDGYNSSMGLLQRRVLQPLAFLHICLLGFHLHLKLLPAGRWAARCRDPLLVVSCCSLAHRGVGSVSQRSSCFPTGYSTAAFPASLPVFHVLNLTHLATVCVFIQSVYKYTLTSFQPLFISRDPGPLKKILFFASST